MFLEGGSSSVVGVVVANALLLADVKNRTRLAKLLSWIDTGILLEALRQLDRCRTMDGLQADMVVRVVMVFGELLCCGVNFNSSYRAIRRQQAEV